jgi:hypothetical protein
MSHKPLPPRSSLSVEGIFRPPGPSPQGLRRAGPVPSQVRPVSRRQFLRTAGGAGLVLGSALCLPKRVFAGRLDDLTPNPIPIPFVRFGHTFHFVLPGPADQGHEPSTITDFNGFIGVANGTGNATDGSGNTFGCDMRFMKGEYIDVSGKHHQGAFAFL